MLRKLSCLKNICSKDVENFTGGSLRFGEKFWKNHTKDPEILSLVTNMKIEITADYVPNQRVTFAEGTDKILIEKQLSEMLKHDIIEPVSVTCPDEYISTIFLVKKKDKSNRLILNLKMFNDHVQKRHFKMNSLNSAIELMTKNCYMASVDFKSAYYSVPVCKTYRKYLRFVFNGVKYQFTCLPMGLTSGPREFTKIVKVLFTVLREKGYSNTFYIDDSLIFGSTWQECAQNTIDTIEYSRSAGFTISPTKSVFEPVTKISYLGFILNSVEMTVKLTPEKCADLKEKITFALNQNLISIQFVSQIVGKMVASFPGVAFGRLYYRQLDVEKTRALAKSRGDYSHLMSLSNRAKEDLNWWFCNIDSSYVDVTTRNPHKTLHTDASNLGFGGMSDGKTFSGQWKEQEKNLHINLKELLAVKYCLFHIFDQSSNICIKVLTDNTTTMHYIGNMGGKILPCHEITREIWEWAIQRNIWLISCFIPGKFNVAADKLSRLLNETTEWSLSQKYFTKILTKFPQISVDLFASDMNYKLPQYVSWLPDKNAFESNAFTISWKKFVGYAFPPFNLIGRVLKKVELEGSNVILIVPEWRSQYWFAKLMTMLIEPPMFLPRGRVVLENPVNARATPITSRLMVCNIAGSRKTIQESTKASEPSF